MKFLIFTCFLHLASATHLSSGGDVIVAGLFSVYEAGDGGTCSGSYGNIRTSSVMYAEAIKWYFQQLYSLDGLPFQIGKEGILIQSVNSICLQRSGKAGLKIQT